MIAKQLHHNPTRKRGTWLHLNQNPSLTLRVRIVAILTTGREIRDDIIAVEQEAEGFLDQYLHGGVA